MVLKSSSKHRLIDIHPAILDLRFPLNLEQFRNITPALSVGNDIAIQIITDPYLGKTLPDKFPIIFFGVFVVYLSAVIAGKLEEKLSSDNS